MATRPRRSPRSKSIRSYHSPACYLHEAVRGIGRGRTDARIQIKRVYDGADKTDGYRVLVDRLWPRGITKRRAALDEWVKELAPSTALRVWFHGDRSDWTEFVRRYRAELRAAAPTLDALRKHARRQRVTLLYGARDPQCNHAIVLRDVLREE